MSRRTQRIGDLLRREIAEIIVRRLKDPRVGLATVSAVDVSPDLKHARVRVSILGNEENRDECMEALDHASGYIRSQVARGLKNMRVVPDLIFELDRGPEYSQHIDHLLEHLDDPD